MPSKPNPAAAARTFSDLHRLFIEPELRRRQEAGALPENFRIRCCLVLLPRDRAPVVTFNDEVGWEARMQLGPGFAGAVGDPVFLAQFQAVDAVRPPTIDGKRVACIYLYRGAGCWKLLWDASPNLPPEFGVVDEGAEWPLGKLIAQSIAEELAWRSLGRCVHAEAELAKFGLWAVPALVPSPLTAIAEKCVAGDLDAARATLLEHCTSDFLAGRVDRWNSNPVFQAREALFRDALYAHREGRPSLTVSALAPHVEGVVTDWLRANTESLPFRIESKLRKLNDVVRTRLADHRNDAEVARSVVDFITKGTMLKDFKDWQSTAPTDPFPNRHALAHGQYDARRFTSEASVKLFLLLDTLHHLFDKDRLLAADLDE
jgi:hypothetical protein